MQAPPPVNAKGFTPSAVDGKLDTGPSQEDVHSTIESVKAEHKGNTANSTSRRLAETAGSLGGHTFKQTVGTVNGHHEGYILPSDVDEQAFLGFIDEVKQIVGEKNVAVNYDPAHQAEADYEAQPKFYDFFAIQPREENMASAVIQPDSTEEVSLIIKAANKFKMPVSPVSIGRNLGSANLACHGGAIH